MSSKAQLSKEKGNEAFKAGKYADAVGFYTAAIIADRTEPTYPLNRAAAYLKLGKNEDAERDCTTVVSLMPKNAIATKALFRRGQAKVEMGKVNDGLTDFYDAAKMAPEDPNIAKAILDAQAKIEAKEQRAKASTRARALDIDPKSPPRRRRVPIEIVDPSHSASAPSPVAEKPNSDGAGLTAVSSRPLKPASSSPPPPTSSTPPPETATPESSKPQPVARAEINPLPSSEKPSSFIEAKQSRDTARPSRVAGGIFSNKSAPKFFPSRDVVPAAQSDVKKTAFRTPPTFSDLVKVWNSLKAAEDRWALLSTIPPAQFPALAKFSLEPVFLASIFETLHQVLPTADRDTQATVRAFLESLPNVSRFNTIFLFLTKKEKESVKGLWKILGGEVNANWTTLLK